MNIVKEQLTFDEVYDFINQVVESSFGKDENGNDVEFRPMAKYTAIQSLFCEYYTDLEFTDDFETNYAKYIDVNFNNISDINRIQWNYMLNSIDEAVEFRKQKMLQNNNTVSNYVTDLLKEQIETIKLQKKILKQTEELNSQYTKKDIDKMMKLLDRSNKNFASKDYIMSVAEAVHNDKTIKPVVENKDTTEE